jgi:hypothetical protein
MFAYYRIPDRRISFRLIADRHILALRRKGHIVLERDLWFTGDSLRDVTRHENSIALVHPLFYYANWFGVSLNQIMEVLQQRHRSVYGFEVGDTNAISGRFVQWANHPGIEGIMLPSQFSVDSFRNSGVTTSLEKVPHGIEIETPDNSFEFLKEHAGPKILFFTVRDHRRKGLDLLRKIIPSFPGCTFVIKTTQCNWRTRFSSGWKNPLVIDEWLSPGALASLYLNLPGGPCPWNARFGPKLWCCARLLD